jgi:arylsulfatase A-like enzyme
MYPQVVTYSQRLREAGYRQGFVGKWHASWARSPLDFGFDEVMRLQGFPRELIERLQMPPEPPLRADPASVTYTAARRFRWPGSEPFDMWGCYEGPEECLNTSRIADCAIDMIERYTNGSRPWHIAVHFREPHDPYNPHRRYLDLYDGSELPVPESFRDDFVGKPGMHRRESEIWGELSEDDVRQGTHHYFAYCSQIDAQIGRILRSLEQTGEADRTLVAFCADHGDMLGAHRMWIKSWMPYEEVWRMPMILRFPGRIAGGSQCPHLVQTHDLPHTFLELAGAEPLPYRGGRSLVPLFPDHESPDWEDSLLGAGYGCEFFVTQRILFTTRYKYVFNGFDYDEMYDLQSDPHEMHNLIADSSVASVREGLQAKLYELMNRLGDPYGDVGPGDSTDLPASNTPGRFCAPRYLPRGR